MLLKTSIAQQFNEPCGFNLVTNTKSIEVENFEKKLKLALVQNQLRKKSNHSLDVSIIPVVVHVIHNGGIENISDSQVFSQIKILNEDFRKIEGTRGYGAGVDTKIQFCLAKISPESKCTNGIVRIKSTLTNHQTTQRGLLKNLSFWNPNNYLNIYVVNSINNSILGYSSFPGGPEDADGVVCRDDAFGNIGTVSSSSNLGRTMTHEIAHWFGLYHTFQDGCGIDTCADGDKVCDTPPVANPNYGCPTINSCSNDNPNLPDQVKNYADYSNDLCKSMFTAGQAERMHATLKITRANIWSKENLIATGCDSNYKDPLVCSIFADFTVVNPNLCEGSSITFTNRSLNNPSNYSWQFEGGNPSTSSIENPIITYPKAGSYEVRLKVWNNISQDSIIKTKYIVVSTPSVGAKLGINEGFENPIFPWSGITIINPDNGITWERTTKAAFGGIASVRINNIKNINYGQNDDLLLPSYDFTTFVGTPFLKFKWAYVRSDANYSDELSVLVSKDCGLNWNQVFYKTGDNLVTGQTQITEYIPDSSTVWKTANINLTAYATQKNVMLKIINVTDGGNCLYLDNINMGDTTLVFSGIDNIDLKNGIIVFPNPINETFTIKSEMNILGSKIFIHNLQGKLCYEQLLQKSFENTININNQIQNGLYFLEIKNGTNSIIKKIIKQ